MKSIKWIAPLITISALVISGCSQMQQTASPANAANRLTTGNAVGSGLSRGRRTIFGDNKYLPCTNEGGGFIAVHGGRPNLVLFS